ncbi:P-loop containing nucleoside triphosphate hydrolase protein [Mycena alexandri]|uniref:P-loop containing nucleoside triphosphate hydrolase protein n=1 Tax=Mycena alexandri TaxID=1745969 RepID=A0AAD6SF39_9AGAR|nr:P-loop containing nucleoside triphosphate hydrolase protein [Mycena alexandri]
MPLRCSLPKPEFNFSSAVAELSTDIERRHQELLELISTWSESLDAGSSMHESSFNTSSGSLSLLPGSPKIFHGRESELNDLIAMLATEAPRVAILGPGGMGKTTVATAVLHHPVVIGKYNIRHFLSCESANTCADLVATLGSHLELENSRQLSKNILRHFTECGLCLLILDNFETPWEPSESRGAVEDFLSVLADIPSLALLITMRGAERPGKVKWNRPFLPPLEPISHLAARQIFVDLADEPVVEEESTLVELLHFSGSLPLAVTLMANIVSFEGYSGTLARWQLESTTLLSDGHNKYSNLEKSITLSLSSPRMAASPASRDLLSLLSLLPDGITEQDIAASNVPILQIAHCKSSLLRASMAYMDATGRLKSLSPIREYMQRVHPPSLSLCRPLRTHFEALLSIWRVHEELPSGNLVPRLMGSLGNVNGLVIQGLTEDRPYWVQIGQSILTLNHLSVTMLKGC